MTQCQYNVRLGFKLYWSRLEEINLCYLSGKIKIKSYLSEWYGLKGYSAHFLSYGLWSSDCDNFKCRTYKTNKMTSNVLSVDKAIYFESQFYYELFPNESIIHPYLMPKYNYILISNLLRFTQTLRSHAINSHSN